MGILLALPNVDALDPRYLLFDYCPSADMFPNVLFTLCVPGPTLLNIVTPLRLDNDLDLDGLNLVQPEDLFLLLPYVPTGFILSVLQR
jgi:hypothetical protein